MVKAVVYALVATAFIVFLATSPGTRRAHRDGDRWVAANRRLGAKFRAPNFDPLVTRMERKDENIHYFHYHDDEDEEDHSHIGNIDDPSGEYFNDEGKLNISLRLMVLFPFIDKEPKDGFISAEELEAWNVMQAKDRLFYRTHKEMNYYDKDGDGEISFREYLPHFSEDEIEKSRTEHGDAGWWKEQIQNADLDRNGTLSFTEFMDFLHPEDSNNKEVQRWLLKEKLKRMDSNHDDKLSLEEFSDHVYTFYKTYAEFEDEGAGVPSPEEKFDSLDVNKDKVLDLEELIPILSYLHPGEVSHAKYYSKYLIHEADDNQDGKLSLDEMLNHQLLFYTSLLDIDEDDDDFHDEL